MNSNKCLECEDNYLLKLFNKCMIECKLTDDAIVKFDRVCFRTGDPRSPIAIIRSLHENTCNECIKYRKYYQDLQ